MTQNPDCTDEEGVVREQDSVGRRHAVCDELRALGPVDAGEAVTERQLNRHDGVRDGMEKALRQRLSGAGEVAQE